MPDNVAVAVNSDLTGNVNRPAATPTHYMRPTERRTKLRRVEEVNMLVSIRQQSLIVRLSSENAKKAMKKDYVREFDVTGQPMKGWIMIEADGLDADKQLAEWIEQALAFVELLPAK